MPINSSKMVNNLLCIDNDIMNTVKMSGLRLFILELYPKNITDFIKNWICV